MAIVRRYGKPHLFITFTCNVQWPEIQSSLFEGQTANDRPDIICRVFRLKLSDLLKDVVQRQIFGTVLAYVQTIEFQKRGLPHAHMLFILSGRQHCWQEVDRLVCASCRTKLYTRDCSTSSPAVCCMESAAPVVRVSRTAVAPRTFLSRSVIRRQWAMTHTHFIAGGRLKMAVKRSRSTFAVRPL